MRGYCPLNRLLNNNVSAHTWAIETHDWFPNAQLCSIIWRHISMIPTSPCLTQKLYFINILQRSASISVFAFLWWSWLHQQLPLFVQSKQVRNPSSTNCSRRLAFRLARQLFYLFLQITQQNILRSTVESKSKCASCYSMGGFWNHVNIAAGGCSSRDVSPETCIITCKPNN